MAESALYYEAHVTLEPVLDELRRHRLFEIAEQHSFRVAELLMRKRAKDTPKRSRDDSFMTTRHKDYDTIRTRVACVVADLQEAGFDVWRYKIEDTLLDSQIEAAPDIPLSAG